ncbi:MAG: hypothetical protein QJR05_10605 [Thermoanaerobacterium sp.]|nr:hypothetical protein [Thermoanaerobacterium sp.]
MKKQLICAALALGLIGSSTSAFAATVTKKYRSKLRRGLLESN